MKTGSGRFFYVFFTAVVLLLQKLDFSIFHVVETERLL